MILDLLTRMAAGAIGGVFVATIAEVWGVPGPGIVLLAGAMGAVVADLLREERDPYDDGLGYARRDRR